MQKGVTSYDSDAKKHVIDSDKVTLQKALISEALERGADANKVLELELGIQHSNSLVQAVIDHPHSSKKILVKVLIQTLDSVFKSLAKTILDFAIKPDCAKSIKKAYEKINDDEWIKSSIDEKASEALQYMISEAPQENAIDIQHFFNMKYKNIDLSHNVDCVGQKVPSVLHHIWLTNALTKREIKEKDLENLKKNMELFITSKYDWDFVVWVNDKNLIPKSVEKLESMGVKIQENKYYSIKKH